MSRRRLCLRHIRRPKRAPSPLGHLRRKSITFPQIDGHSPKAHIAQARTSVSAVHSPPKHALPACDTLTRRAVARLYAAVMDMGATFPLFSWLSRLCRNAVRSGYARASSAAIHPPEPGPLSRRASDDNACVGGPEPPPADQRLFIWSGKPDRTAKWRSHPTLPLASGTSPTLNHRDDLVFVGH